MNEKSIAIIGGGYSGVMAAIAIAKAKPRYQVTLIDPHPFGLGVAYSTPYDYHLLNVPAGKMSAFADNPDHFVQWLSKNNYANPSYQDEPLEQHFISRRVYGLYIQSILEESAPSLKNLLLLEEEVLDCTPKGNGWQVQFKDNEPYPFDAVVLALGNSKPQGFFNFKKNQQIIDNPWDWDKIAAIDKSKNVVIVGSGLTMIDVVLTLKNNKHQGKITALSRHGYLPHAHDLTAKPQPLEACANTPRGLLKQIKQSLDNPEVNWRSMIDGLRPQTQKLWQQFGENEQRRFLRHLRCIWDVHRHRIAKPIAENVHNLIDQGQLSVVAGRINHLDQSTASLKLSYRPRHQSQTEVISADTIVNCIGPSSDYSKLGSPLIRSLLEQDILCPCPLKLGIHVTPNGALINKQGEAYSNLFSIGPPTKGVLWEIIAVPDIRNQVESLTIAL